MDKPILVTGGAGFIGSHLCATLLARGYSLRVLDNLSTGRRSNLPEDPHLYFKQADIADEAVVNQMAIGCQAAIHLAAIASVQASIEHPMRAHRNNFTGTLILSEALRQAGVKRVIYASSAAVYGRQGQGTAISETTSTDPLTPYAIDKLMGEYYLHFYRHAHGLEPVILRFFNVYGPRQDPFSPYSGVISIFTQRARNHLPIQVFGDGEQTRDFIYVGDLVEIICQALVTPLPWNQPINIGSGSSISLNQLLQTIGAHLGGLPPVAYLPGRPGDIRHSQANIQLLKNYLTLSFTPLEVGLAAVLAE